MREQSKAAKRRFYDGAFHSKYFVGSGIDIGGKPDPLSYYKEIFRGIKNIRVWDIEDGDAQYLVTLKDETYDFVHSSHCLEHMVNVKIALENWIRVVKPGGYLIITVPDEDMYEQEVWPSKFNQDHKWTFTIYKDKSWSAKSINILELLIEFSSLVGVESVKVIKDFFSEDLRPLKVDQTLTPNAECAIEIILQKK